MEKTIGVTTKFSIALSEQIDEAVAQYGFKNTSEFIRSCVTYFFDFMELGEKLKDPEVNRKFIEEHDPLIQAERDILRIDQVVGHMTQEEINRYQFALAKESNKRITITNRSLKMNKEVMRRGGEINPKIGYWEAYHDDGSVFYVPIEPRNDTKWKELSMLEKETLRDELKIKLEAYSQRYPDDQHEPSFAYVLKEITEAIDREKK
ncbi:ribbon-helix-helix domain-containing protein [Nitrosopumilus sp.]|nr:ribbon-helix-helix domain-containing protein [Nitrosopumilus sp.]